MYSLTLIFGLFILIILYSLFVKIFTGKNPSVFFKGILPAQLVAAGAKSLITMRQKMPNKQSYKEKVTVNGTTMGEGG